MSWDSYIDNLIGHSQESTDKVAIIGLDGSMWTTSGHPKAICLSAGESQTIGKVMKTQDYSSFQANGIHIEGIKYQYLKEDDNVVLGKKKDNGAITMQKSKTAVVIGHTVEGGQPGSTNKAVGIIADYLETMNM